MVIEKKYYDIAQRELEEIQREINEEKAQMSEEEILEDKKWHDEQLETIIKKAEAHMRRFKKVPSPLPDHSQSHTTAQIYLDNANKK